MASRVAAAANLAMPAFSGRLPDGAAADPMSRRLAANSPITSGTKEAGHNHQVHGIFKEQGMNIGSRRAPGKRLTPAASAPAARPQPP
jgi:hypothetical protein